jgi:hypothetical protein
MTKDELIRQVRAAQARGQRARYAPPVRAAVIQYATEFRAANVSWRDISKELGVGASLVQRWISGRPRLLPVKVIAPVTQIADLVARDRIFRRRAARSKRSVSIAARSLVTNAVRAAGKETDHGAYWHRSGSESKCGLRGEHRGCRAARANHSDVARSSASSRSNRRVGSRSSRARRVASSRTECANRGTMSA